MFKNALKFIPITTFASSSMLATYQPINSSGLPFTCLNVSINNRSNQDITISFDGTTDHFVVAANFIQSFISNVINATTPDGVKFPRGTIVYVKGTAGTGNIYLAGNYLEV